MTAPVPVAPSADLAVGIADAPDPVTIGQNLVYTITVTNNGPSTADAVMVTNPTPTGLTFLSNAGACTTVFPCNLGSIPSGAAGE
jgi:uncharacterized repeat protein (TIGR01451 family)